MSTYNLSELDNRYLRTPRVMQNNQLGFVRLKLQGFIFEVSQYRKDEKTNASAQLRKLMKPYRHLLLDPQYTSSMITIYHPLSIQAAICKLFQNAGKTLEHVTAGLFVVNDIGAMVNRERHDRLLHLFFQITSSIGMPTITWMPNRIGEFELDESQLSIRLEPLTWHMARALVDFSQAFNWNIILIVYNVDVPGSKPLVAEMKILQGERGTQDHPNFYEFEIDSYLPFSGFTKSKLTLCIQQQSKSKDFCFNSLMNALQQIWESVGHVIIFNGNQYDLNALMWIADNLKNTENEHLLELFEEDYVWIFTPSTMAPLTIADHIDTISRDNIVLSEFTMFKKIPGMFGLICLNDIDNRRKHAALAREVWHRSLMELVNQMTEIYRPTKNHTLTGTIAPDTYAYYRGLLEKLRPGNLCDGSDHMVWQWGQRLNGIMRSLELTFEGEPVSFLPNGGLNVSKFLIFNSRTSSGTMNWFKVGTWSMSSKWGRSKSRLSIDGVTWPGMANSPPIGRAHNIRLKISMLEEQPFLIFGGIQEDGKCDANSIFCWIHPRKDYGKAGHTPLPGQPKVPIEGSKLGVSTRGNKSGHFSDIMQAACCTGLTMDLLMELMKDLNFEVDLYEVKDRHWGGWTSDGWNGLVRELLEHRADMVVTSLKITPNRSEQVDFSVPFLETGIAISVALREGAISPTAFLEPYDYQCWCIILVFSVHASGAAIYFYEWLSPIGLDRGRLRTPEHRFTIFRSFWLIWSMLFGAAVNADNPRGMASRFMANIWALFALVFLASYTANLAAFMISKDDFYDLNGINDWRLQQPWNHKPPFRFATVPSGATEENIKINFPDMSAYMRTFNRTTVIEGLKSLKLEEIDAFIYDATVLEYWTSRDDGCKLKTVGNIYAMTGYGIGFPKNSRWLQKINSRILHYQKNGKFHRWKQFWLSGACKKVNVIGNTNKTLGVKNFISAFILLMCGLLLCASMFVMEHAFYRYIRPRITCKDRYGCIRTASNTKSKDIEANAGPVVEDKKERRVEGTDGCTLLASGDCQNVICRSQQIKSQQEISKLSHQLQLLINDVREKNKIIGSQRKHKQKGNTCRLPEIVQRTDKIHENSTGGVFSKIKKNPRKHCFKENLDALPRLSSSKSTSEKINVFHESQTQVKQYSIHWPNLSQRHRLPVNFIPTCIESPAIDENHKTGEINHTTPTARRRTSKDSEKLSTFMVSRWVSDDEVTMPVETRVNIYENEEVLQEGGCQLTGVTFPFQRPSSSLCSRRECVEKESVI